MRNINIDRSWEFSYGLRNNYEVRSDIGTRIVDLPHDYMIEQDVAADAPAGPASGFFTGRVANYTKFFDVPADWDGDRIGLRFDGVMQNATVEVNGSRCITQHYGYVPFYADITEAVYPGKRNRVTVTVNPAMQPNSRWYAGSGIFRSVELVHTPALHIANDGIFAYTTSVDWDSDGEPVYAYVRAEIEIQNEASRNSLARVEIFLKEDGSDEIVTSGKMLVEVLPSSTEKAKLLLTVRAPKLWDAENPNLYRVCVRVTDESFYKTRIIKNENPSVDETGVLFGIRTITADPVHGLRINGKTVKLKGGCVHHDNGMLGAVSLYDSEARRVKNLKDVGFNAIRTAHNPPSAALTEACARLGLYIFDEAFDAWGIMKQPGDYNQYFDADWERDLTRFVKRDRNNPAVIIWSTGNEIPERGGLGGGYVLASRLAARVKELDPSRPVSNGICSYWSGLDDGLMAEILRSYQKDASESGELQNADVKSSNEYQWEEYSEPFTNGLDIVGYNYMEDKYEADHEMFPGRVMLGSENFPQQIGFRWPLVEKLPYVIGDFTWTAVDYIGEAGIGKSIFVPEGDPAIERGPWGLMSHGSRFPYRLANDADIDINGGRTVQGDYRSVVWGNPETFVYSYDPENFGKTEITSMWGFTDARKTWTWDCKEGTPIELIAFSNADEVEIFLNNESIGRKNVTEDLPLPRSVRFETEYRPGVLEAVSYKNGREVSRSRLVTHGEPAKIRITPERDVLKADGHSVVYVGVEILDKDGNLADNAQMPLTVEFAGNDFARVAAFGSSNPVTDENYTRGAFTTYRGKATAIIRAGYEAGEAKLTIKSEELGQESVMIRVEDSPCM